MRWERIFTTVDTHCEGEIGRVLTGGILDLPGKTIGEKFVYLNGEGDWIRKFCIQEPRGGAEKTTNLLLPPSHPDADAAFIPMHGDASYPMSGSNSMCVVTALLETGILPMKEPETTVVLEAPAGLVTATARCRDGKCEAVSIEGIPSFVLHLDHPVEIEGRGTITVDVAFGGSFFAFVDAETFGLTLAADEARDVIDTSMKIKPAIAEQIKVRHPTNEALNEAGIRVLPFFYRSPKDGRGVYRNVNVMPPARIDRSPCGTGSSSRLAILHARGIVDVGEKVTFHSIIDGHFETEILRTTRVGDVAAIVPKLTGRAWIYGISQMGVDPTDPFPLGYTLPDTWGAIPKEG